MDATPQCSAAPVAKTPGTSLQIKVHVKAYEPCPVHGPLHELCDCEKVLIGEFCKDDDLATKQLAQFIQSLILGSTQTITDTSSATHSVANGTATSAPTILAGTGATAAAVTDVALQTQTEAVAATVNAYSGVGTVGTFTVTGTIIAGAARVYTEVGLRITCATFLYLLCRDIVGSWNVSNGGTLQTTYTFTLG